MLEILKNIIRKLKCNRGSFGGGDTTTVEAPKAPQQVSPLETSRQAIQGQVEALPQILQAQQEFGPQFAQQSLDQAGEFGPKFAQQAIDLESQFGPQLAQATLDSQNVLDPARGAGSRAIADFIGEGAEDLTEFDRARIQEDARAAGSTRGLAESGFGAIDEVARLFGARQQLKSRYLNVALAASGRLPGAGGQTVGANPMANTGQLVQNVSPNNMFGAQSSNNQLAGSIFASQAGMFNAQTAANAQNQGGGIGGMLGSAVGIGLGAMTGGLGTAAAGGIASMMSK